MRVYELVYIVKPDLPEEEVDASLASVRETLESGGATIDKEEKWGKRRLAYRVQRFEDGYYVLFQYSLDGNSDLPKEVERRLRVADPVLKFMTIRIDEDLKRVEKAKKKREGRSSRRPAAGPGRPSSDSGSSSGASAPGLPGSGESKSADESKSSDDSRSSGEPKSGDESKSSGEPKGADESQDDKADSSKSES